MSLRDEIRRMAREFDAQDDAAADLWTWLPSYAAAQRHFGDRACEHRPGIADLMREASILLAEVRGYEHADAEIAEWFYCCTDDIEDPPSGAEKVAFVRAWLAERGFHRKSETRPTVLGGGERCTG